MTVTSARPCDQCRRGRQPDCRCRDGHISPIELASWIKDRRPGLRVIDVRSPAAFDDYHVPTAEHQSSQALDAWPRTTDQVVVIYGDDDGQSADVVKSLHGRVQAFVLSGGVPAWIADVMSPTLATNASPQDQAAFAKTSELSRYFGGTPRTGVATTAHPPQRTPFNRYAGAAAERPPHFPADTDSLRRQPTDATVHATLDHRPSTPTLDPRPTTTNDYRLSYHRLAMTIPARIHPYVSFASSSRRRRCCRSCRCGRRQPSGSRSWVRARGSCRGSRDRRLEAPCPGSSSRRRCLASSSAPWTSRAGACSCRPGWLDARSRVRPRGRTAGGGNGCRRAAPPRRAGAA